jgi:hypothetical protein
MGKVAVAATMRLRDGPEPSHRRALSCTRPAFEEIDNIRKLCIGLIIEGDHFLN